MLLGVGPFGHGQQLLSALVVGFLLIAASASLENSDLSEESPYKLFDLKWALEQRLHTKMRPLPTPKTSISGGGTPLSAAEIACWSYKGDLQRWVCLRELHRFYWLMRAHNKDIERDYGCEKGRVRLVKPVFGSLGSHGGNIQQVEQATFGPLLVEAEEALFWQEEFEKLPLCPVFMQPVSPSKRSTFLRNFDELMVTRLFEQHQVLCELSKEKDTSSESYKGTPDKERETSETRSDDGVKKERRRNAKRKVEESSDHEVSGEEYDSDGYVSSKSQEIACESLNRQKQVCESRRTICGKDRHEKTKQPTESKGRIRNIRVLREKEKEEEDESGSVSGSVSMSASEDESVSASKSESENEVESETKVEARKHGTCSTTGTTQKNANRRKKVDSDLEKGGRGTERDVESQGTEKAKTLGIKYRLLVSRQRMNKSRREDQRSSSDSITSERNRREDKKSLSRAEKPSSRNSPSDRPAPKLVHPSMGKTGKRSAKLSKQRHRQYTKLTDTFEKAERARFWKYQNNFLTVVEKVYALAQRWVRAEAKSYPESKHDYVHWEKQVSMLCEIFSLATSESGTDRILDLHVTMEARKHSLVEFVQRYRQVLEKKADELKEKNMFFMLAFLLALQEREQLLLLDCFSELIDDDINTWDMAYEQSVLAKLAKSFDRSVIPMVILYMAAPELILKDKRNVSPKACLLLLRKAIDAEDQTAYEGALAAVEGLHKTVTEHHEQETQEMARKWRRDDDSEEYTGSEGYHFRVGRGYHKSDSETGKEGESRD